MLLILSSACCDWLTLEMKKKDEKRYLKAYQKQLNKPKYGVRSYRFVFICFYLAGFSLCVFSGYVLGKDSFWSELFRIFGGISIGIGWFFRIALPQWEAIAPHISMASIDERIRELEL